MINLDSVKLHFSKDLILFEPAKYNKTTAEKNDIQLISYKAKPQYLRTGIKEIYVNDNFCTIDISSKLLPELYHNMININTIEKYLSEVATTGMLSYDIDEVINHSLVRTCDTTNNMKVSNVATYVNSLMVYKFNSKYNFKYWIDQSVSFDRKVKTNKYREHLTVYNKLPELLTAKNKDFRTGIDLNSFKNVIRFESRFTTFELMRKSFEVNDHSLLSILNSTAKVNYNILNRITDIEDIDIEIINNYNTLIEMKKRIKHSMIRNIQGDLNILHSCNYDMDLLRQYFKTNSTANNSKYIKHYEELLKAKNKIDKKISIDDKVNEMKEFLKVA